MSSKSIIESDELPNPPPGDILRLEFLEPAGLTAGDLADALLVPSRRVLEISRGRRRIDADMDLRLARYFGLSAGFFLRL